MPDEEVAGKVAGKTQDKILEILKDNPKATVAMMMAQLSMSDYGIRKNLKALKEKVLSSVLARIRRSIGKFFEPCHNLRIDWGVFGERTQKEKKNFRT